jgi:hypothetical protein
MDMGPKKWKQILIEVTGSFNWGCSIQVSLKYVSLSIWGSFCGFSNAKYCGYCLTVNYLFFSLRHGVLNIPFKLRRVSTVEGKLRKRMER